MVDGVIELRSSLHGRRAERDLQVHKLRGSWFMGGRHSYRITANGHSVYPRLEALLETPSSGDGADGPMVSSGIPALDTMFGGGIDTHSVTMVIGPSGSGKTTAASAVSDRRSGGRTGDAVRLPRKSGRRSTLRRTASGCRCKRARQTISLLWRPQTEAILDEVASELLTAIRERGVRRLVIDGIEGFSKLTDEKGRIGRFPARAVQRAARSRGYDAGDGRDSIRPECIPGSRSRASTRPGFSAIAENIIALQMAALRSESHRLMTILKSRDRETDMRMRRFEIAQGGIRIEDDHRKGRSVAAAIVRARAQYPTPAAAIAVGDLSVRTVLIVEDEWAIADWLEFLFSEQAFNVLDGRNGREALEILHREIPDLVLTDFMMPHLDGAGLSPRCRTTRG